MLLFVVYPEKRVSNTWDLSAAHAKSALISWKGTYGAHIAQLTVADVIEILASVCVILYFA